MTEERPAKLKLKRKKCMTAAQSVEETHSKPQSLPTLDLRQSSDGSWFDEIDLTTAEQLWKQVLSCMSPDLRSMARGAVPGLPDYTPQVVGRGVEKTSVMEVFKVGHESFEWSPFPAVFPPAVAEQPCATDPASQRVEEWAEPEFSNFKNHSPLYLSTVTHLETRSMVPGSKENDQLCDKNSTQNCKELRRGDVKHLNKMAFQKSSSETVKAPATAKKSSTKSVAVSQSLQKSLADNIRDLPTSEKRSKKAIQGPHVWQKGSSRNVREPQTSPKQTFSLWPTLTLAKKSKEELKRTEPPTQEASECNDVINIEEEPDSVGGGGLQVVQESADKATEAAGSLENCPICLMQFPRQFSQLDMDSHLAQCLSETTVDVVW